MTRKQAHAQGIEFLEIAANSMDQAFAQFKDARTAGGVATKHESRHICARDVNGILTELLQAARQVTCEDCDALIADCQCAWANEEVK